MDSALSSTGARTALERIVESTAVDDDLHRELRAAEAGLRDHLRCPCLEHPGLTPEIAAARLRGIEVVLLGPSPSESGGTDRLTAALAGEVALVVRRAEPGDRITIRRLRTGAGPVVLTLLVLRSDGSARLRSFSRDGAVIDET